VSKQLCFACEEGHLDLTVVPERARHNGVDVFVPGYKALVCDSCGERFVSPELAKLNAVTIADAKRKADELLSSEEIEGIRTVLGLTQQQMAKVFGGGPNAFSKYLRGEVIQTRSMNLLLRLALDLPEARSKLFEYAGLDEKSQRDSRGNWEQLCSNVVRAHFAKPHEKTYKIDAPAENDDSDEWVPTQGRAACR
jgi:putative zinc finger/helix-turn-helix YgiT family protein